MPKYAAVAIWRARDTNQLLPHNFGKHAAMMLIDSPHPLDKLPIKETLLLEDSDIEDDFVEISMQKQDSSIRFKTIDFSLEPGVIIDSYLSINYETTNSSAFKEFELYGRVPDEYVLLPTNGEGQIGVDYQKIQHWWQSYAAQYNAYTCVTTDVLELEDEDIERLLMQKETQYCLIKGFLHTYQLAYLDEKGRMRKYDLSEQQKEQLSQIQKEHRFNWEGKQESNERARAFIAQLAQQLPEHTPTQRIYYDIFINNCSTVIREALKQGGANLIVGKDIADVAFSSPNGLIKQAYQIKRDCPRTLQQFVDTCVEELQRNDAKYRKESKVPTAKLALFLELKYKIAQGEEVALAQVQQAAKMKRSDSLLSTLHSANTYDAFKKFKAEALKTVHQEEPSEGSGEHESTSQSDKENHRLG